MAQKGRNEVPVKESRAKLKTVSGLRYYEEVRLNLAKAVINVSIQKEIIF